MISFREILLRIETAKCPTRCEFYKAAVKAEIVFKNLLVRGFASNSSPAGVLVATPYVLTFIHAPW